MADYNNKIDDEDKMTLYLEDGTEMVCDVIGIFDDGEREYIALFPEDGGEDGDIYLYRFYTENNDFDNVKLENIESDEEFDSAKAAFEAYVEQMEILDDEDEAE